ncbi:MAG: 4-(cytidine 5'-diphospho)-2-C-methyl-D-erythritol kinase [Candidatus Omnitrophota bacterium]
MASSRSLLLSSPAKLNLFLEILGQRPDGYHELLTVFERISLYDTIRLTEIPSPEIIIHSASRDIPLDRANLAYRAAELIFEYCGIKKGVRIEIGKQIPVGGGVGGGSSNAACVLTGLNRLFSLGLDRQSLFVLANQLGSDVAFFISGRRFAVGRGRGGDLSYPKIPQKVRLWHVLFVPNRNILTKDVYERFDRGQKEPKMPQKPPGIFKLTKKCQDVNILLSYLKKADFVSLNRKIYNRLSETVMDSYSFVSEIKSDLSKQGLHSVHMSGSGPTLFTIFRNRKIAQGVYEQARLRLSDRCRIFLAGTV